MVVFVTLSECIFWFLGSVRSGSCVVVVVVVVVAVVAADVAVVVRVGSQMHS